MLNKSNKEADKRDMYLFKEPYYSEHYMGGLRYIDALNVNDIEWLMQNKFLDENECQNYSPSTVRFLEFLKKYPHYVAFGYAISPDRWDYRITIEGIKSVRVPTDIKEIEEFVDLCKDADEFRIAPPRAWWD